MRPGVVDFQIAPLVLISQRENSHPRMQPSRNIAVHIYRNFAAPPLRLRHASQSDEVVLIQTSHGFTPPKLNRPDHVVFDSHSRISNSKCWSSLLPAACSRLRIARATLPDFPITRPISSSATSSSITVSSPSGTSS